MLQSYFQTQACRRNMVPRVDPCMAAVLHRLCQRLTKGRVNGANSNAPEMNISILTKLI